MWVTVCWMGVFAVVNDGVMATWNGGALSQAQFDRFHDGRVFAEGSQDYYIAMAKALYQSIYLPLGYKDKLDKDPGFLAELSRWENQQLARLARDLLGPRKQQLTESECLSFYQDHLSDFQTSAKVSLKVLFVRHIGNHIDPASEQRRTTYQKQLSAGTSIDQLIQQEKPISGDANGTFDNIPIHKLARPLQSAIPELKIHHVSGPIDSSVGAFWVELLDREEASQLPFGAVKQRVINQLHRAQVEDWEKQLLQVHNGLRDDLESILARQARAAGLDKDPEFLRRRDRHFEWRLADLAFLKDCPNILNDQELAGRFQQRMNQFRQSILVLIMIQADRLDHDSLETAARIRNGLVRASDRRLYLSELSQKAGILVHYSGPMNREQQRRVHPELPGLVKRLNVGDVSEPVRWTNVLLSPESDKRHSEAGEVIVLLDDRRDPPFEESRALLYEAFRQYITTGFDVFMAELGPRWQIELVNDSSKP